MQRLLESCAMRELTTGTIRWHNRSPGNMQLKYIFRMGTAKGFVILLSNSCDPGTSDQKEQTDSESLFQLYYSQADQFGTLFAPA